MNTYTFRHLDEMQKSIFYSTSGEALVNSSEYSAVKFDLTSFPYLVIHSATPLVCCDIISTDAD